MKESKKRPTAMLFFLGAILIFFSSIIDEYLQKKWIFYLIIGTGLFIFTIAIYRVFLNVNKGYLEGLKKLKNEKNNSDDGPLS